MDFVLDWIFALSRFCRGHLSLFSLALLGVLLALYGPTLNARLQGAIGGINFVLRCLVSAALCLTACGLLLVYATPWVAHMLGYFNNYTLGPVMLLVFFLVGVLADRS